MKNEIDTSIFWNPKETLTHNCLFNIILGNRGGGKSFGAKQWAIDNFIKKHEQFGYIRRYKEDLTKPMKQFFTDISIYYPDYEFKVDGDKFYIRVKASNEKVKWSDKDIAGYGFVLSTANNKKSVSYPNITTLIYDEFLLDNRSFQRYIPEEVICLLNLYETVARPGTQHPRCILFMLANAISITNPYFLFWGLKMPNKADGNGKFIWKDKKRSILVEDVRNDKFIDIKKNTEFGKIIEGTKYAEYSIDNKFLLDDETFIESKPSYSQYYFTFTYKDITLGVWFSMRDGKMYVSKSIDKTYPIHYSITLKDHKPNTMLLKSKSRSLHFKTFLENYKMGNVRFEDMNIKNITYEVIQTSMNI